MTVRKSWRCCVSERNHPGRFSPVLSGRDNRVHPPRRIHKRDSAGLFALWSSSGFGNHRTVPVAHGVIGTGTIELSPWFVTKRLPCRSFFYIMGVRAAVLCGSAFCGAQCFALRKRISFFGSAESGYDNYYTGKR